MTLAGFGRIIFRIFMSIATVFKRKSTYVILVLVVLVGWWLWSQAQAAKQVTYETADVQKRTLAQTVEVTGEIKPAARIDLAFKSGGTLELVKVKIGDRVKPGDVLAELENQDAQFSYQRAKAALAMSQANLNLRLAGETQESIRVAQAGVDQAQAAYDKAVADLGNTKIQVQNDLKNAQIALETSQNNFDRSAPLSDQSLANAIETSRISLKNSLGPLNTALTDGDAIVGVDDTASNQLYKTFLGALSDGSLEKAKNGYRLAKVDKLAAESLVNSLTNASSKSEILAAADKIQKAVESTQAFLLDVKYVLANTITSSFFSTTDLTAKKTTIDADYNSVSAQKTTVATAKQAMESATLSNAAEVTKLQDALSAAKVAYDVAQTNVQMKITAAESAVSVQKAALEAARATLELKKAPPRPVDVASLRAAVSESQAALGQAENALNNASIISPVEGIVSDVVSDIGELVTPNTPQVRMVGTASYDIEAKVPEADISKIVVGQAAEFTLDAYGDDMKFQGTVTALDPDQTLVQDAVYYKMRVTVAPTDKVVKPGMTANVTVTTGQAENALVIPLRSVKTESELKKVRILVNGRPEQKTVNLGLKGDEGQVQVVSGLQEGDKVILSEKTGG